MIIEPMTEMLTRMTAALCLILVGCAPRASGSAGSGPLDRSVVPPAGSTPTYDFPEIERHTLANGLRVWVVERPGVPMVSLQLVVDAGANADPADRPGLASLTVEMLREGTTRRNAHQIADELEFLAVSLGTSAGRDAASVSMTTLSRNLTAALDVFADVVMRPAFDERDWMRVRDQRLASLVQSLDQPATIATREFSRRIYGDEHPLGRPVQGTPASVPRITTSALREFHDTHYHAGNADLIVVGDVRVAALLEELERAFAGWRQGSPPATIQATDPAPRSDVLIYLYDKPGSAQSEIRIGHIGIARDDPDYFPVLVMNTILGGQFTSRINLNLREDKGYTYGARSSFQTGRLPGPFVAQAGVQTEVTRESVIEFVRELEEVRGPRPISAEELEFARASLVRREPLTLETNQQIAGRIEELLVYGLPLDYFDHYNRRIEEVSLADVDRVARAQLDPGRFAILIVGDRARIEDSLRTLPYPLEIVEANDDATAELRRSPDGTL
jgi:zinc protease